MYWLIIIIIIIIIIIRIHQWNCVNKTIIFTLLFIINFFIINLFSHCFLSSSEISVVCNTSSSHVNTNLKYRGFLHKHSLKSKYSSVLYALLHSQLHVLNYSFFKESNHLILYTHNNIHHDYILVWINLHLH